MLAYRKWVLSLGIAAVTPGIALAGPFSFLKSERAAPSSSARENQQLAEQVAKHLRGARLTGFDIEIEVQNGTCLLKGKIADEQQKQKATAACSRVAGIKSVNNQLVVIKTGSPIASEQPIVQAAATAQPEPQVRQAVAQETGPKSVLQTGFFGSKTRKSPARNAGPNEQEVANSIAMAVGQSGLRGHDIGLKFKQGTALLTGQARSPQDVAALTQIVSRVPGVQQVDNQVMAPGMRPAGPPPSRNQQVAEQIAQALAQNQLSGFDIEVRYNDGTATLNGMVPHPQVKAYAQHVASSVAGVNQVSNQIQIPNMGPAGPSGPSFQRPGPPIQQVGFRQQQAGFQQQQAGFRQPGPGGPGMGGPGMPGPGMGAPPQLAHGGGASHMAYDMPNMPAHSWPSYASYPNVATVGYPQEYSASAWPYIGPFYPYPQVPLGWRQVQLEWDDGYWNLNFRPRTEKWFWFLEPKNW